MSGRRSTSKSTPWRSVSIGRRLCKPAGSAGWGASWRTGDVGAVVPRGGVSVGEPMGPFVPAPDTPLVGTSAIREALRDYIDCGARMTLELRKIRMVGDIALVSNVATVT